MGIGFSHSTRDFDESGHSGLHESVPFALGELARTHAAVSPSLATGATAHASERIMKNLLVVAYNFPPCSASSTHRTLGFVKYLAQEGWCSTVLCARNPVEPERDATLLSHIPPGTTVVRTIDLNVLAWRERWHTYRRSRTTNSRELAITPSPNGNAWPRFKRYLAWRLRVPDHYRGWYVHTLWAGFRVLQTRPIDVLYSTGPPWTSHAIARRLARLFSVPWVADFRDPWLSNPFAEIPYPSLRLRNAKAEARTLTTANAVVCILDTMRSDFLARYRERHDDEIVTIQNGVDFDYLSDLAPAPEPLFTVLHAGQLYGRRRIAPLLSALSKWRQIDPEAAEQVHVRLVGGSSEYVEVLRSRIRRAGLQAYVHVDPEVPHREVLRRLSTAAVLLLVGFSGPGAQYQMSGKIFEYLAVRRPILALAPPSSPIGDVLRETRVRHWIVSPDDAAGLVTALLDIGTAWRSGTLLAPEDPVGLERYDRRQQARRLGYTLDRVLVAGSRGSR